MNNNISIIKIIETEVKWIYDEILEMKSEDCLMARLNFFRFFSAIRHTLFAPEKPLVKLHFNLNIYAQEVKLGF